VNQTSKTGWSNLTVCSDLLSNSTSSNETGLFRFVPNGLYRVSPDVGRLLLPSRFSEQQVASSPLKRKKKEFNLTKNF
jgi:hypothetical protein